MHLCPQAERRARAIVGRKPSSQDQHFASFLDWNWLSFYLIAKKRNGIDDSLCVVSRNIKGIAGPGTNGQIDCIKALSKQIVNGKVSSQCDVALQIDTQLPDMINLAIHHILLQAILRDTIAQHATRLRLLLKDLTIMTTQRQIVGTGQSSRS